MSASRNVTLQIGDEGTVSKSKQIVLFGINLSKLTTTAQFLLYVVGVFVFYLIYGYLLELIFTLEGMEAHGWYLTLVQFLYYAAFAVIQILLTKRSIRKKIPWCTYFIIAFLTVGTMGFSNSSVGYLNYPTQVIFKSCKLIPVMIGSVIILGKRYSPLEVIACLCMSIGLIWFTLADSTVQPEFQLIGVLLVSSALLCDAIIGNVQEGAMKKYQEGTTHVVLYSYSLGFFIILIGLLCTNKLFAGISFAMEHPWEVYGRASLFSLAGFCGVQVVLQLVSQFGALVAVTVTTCRKAVTICLSFFLFAKPFTLQYLWGGLLVVIGIYISIYAKNFKDRPLSFIITLQKLFIFIQRYFSPRISHYGKKDSIGILQV
ncbi:adenosine 3'-phospho 5'-phosphosulfate transporter 2 [Oratosquilla oratoria]|uniref:adenosine 3'-phospho 5'-phosphosulfate transporter 2 n=1 Tax=Oratosquilla oratoria TaxID=337810 RepID=UPI003F76C8F5